ncbi:MAG: FAD-dependent monooxygenase [Geodermatophilaceae bacterium]
MDIDTDVCIVGGGPAGMTLALLLLHSGARVVVAERAKSFDREYRGEILQPGAMALLDELGVLEPARRRGGYELTRFRLIEHDRVLMDIDYGTLPRPYDFLLSIPQRHLLEELLAACRRYTGFTYLDGCSLRELLREGSRVTGARCAGGDREHLIRAHVVVGADGRYAKSRQLANIDYRRLDAFDHDVLWLRIPAEQRSTRDVRVYRAGGNPVLIYDSFPDSIQIGWTLPHSGYRELARQGFDEVKAQILRAVPLYSDTIDAQLRDMRDLTLLDVFSGAAMRWSADGFVLAGDSAHTHSPIGAQGINLAIQDAVLLHPVLIESLHLGDAAAETLGSWEAARRVDIDKVFALQVRQSKAMLGGNDSRVGRLLRPAVAGLLAHTPIYRKILRQIAHGSRPIRIRSDLFTADYQGRETA